MTGIEPAVVAAISTGLSVAQSRQQQRAQSSAMAEQARAKLEEIEKRRQVLQRQERDKLRRDVATQRARFGASGLTSSRSADAILANLQRETERRLADQDWFFNRDTSSTRNGVSTSSKPNLLDFGQSIVGGFSGIANQLSSSTPRVSLLSSGRSGNPRR